MATTIPLVADNDLIRTSWANTVRTEVSNLDAAAVKKTGAQTMAGPLTVSGSVAVNGGLNINSSGDHMILMRATSPYISWYDESGTVRRAYMQWRAGGLLVLCDSGDIDFSVAGSTQLHLDANNVLFGKTASDSNNNGVEIFSGASNVNAGRVTSTISADTAYANYVGKHMPSMDANGKFFALWQRSSASTSIGSITQVNLTGVAYNTTSDYRLKDDLGPVDNPIGRLMALNPRHVRWKEDQSETDSFLAHEVQTVAPYAVTGAKDATRPANDEFDPGGIDPQQLDASRLVPLLTAALQGAVTQIEALEQRVNDLEGRIAA